MTQLTKSAVSKLLFSKLLVKESWLYTISHLIQLINMSVYETENPGVTGQFFHKICESWISTIIAGLKYKIFEEIANLVVVHVLMLSVGYVFLMS